MSLNRAMFIGHLTADPELRYTAQGTAVSSFSVATNRVWTDTSGQRQESAEFTRCVAWAKLAEICSQILKKGRQVYVDGRLQTREWEGQDGVKRRTTELVVENMIALGSPGQPGDRTVPGQPGDRTVPGQPAPSPQAATDDDLAVFDEEAKLEKEEEKGQGKRKGKKGQKKSHVKDSPDEEVPPEDIPF